MNPTRSSSRRRGALLVHVLRVGLLAAVVWLIHDAHYQRRGNAVPDGLRGVDEAVVRDLYGADARINGDTGAVADASGNVLGRMLQTSPQCDHIIGFSGPTNLLLAFDAENRILGMRVLSSDDTKEHVHQVVNAGFLGLFNGRRAADVARLGDPTREGQQVDAVSGATLTSFAIVESIVHRLGGGLGSLKFQELPDLADVRPLFPEAAQMKPDAAGSAWWSVDNDQGREQGSVLRTSPAADNIVGYQGPTETFIGFDPQGHVIGIIVGDSYDNEPYVDYVRDDAWFLNSFNGVSLAELSELDLEAAGVEGVSGATMTSMAVARGMVAAAARRIDERIATRSASPTLTVSGMLAAVARLSVRNWGTMAVAVAGVVIGLTSLRGNKWVRVLFQCVLIGYLGFVNGDLLSQASFVGWAKHGVPWETMLGMFLLTSAALLVPITTKHNVYCHHLCPHGAAQQWLRPTSSRHVHVPRRLDRMLKLIPGALLLLVVSVGMGAVSLSLVDIEPFDAYLVGIAGTATITIAACGLIVSAFVPMAYCRYGCPTGALLEYVRRHFRSDRLTPRDAVAAACLATAIVLRW